MTTGKRNARRVYLDLTHVGRHVTGIERIAIELFEKAEFDGVDIVPVRASGLASLIFRQQVLFPYLALRDRGALFVFPGFPPSPLMALFRERVVQYVHDLFLLTRRQDLGLRAKLYMALPFRRAVTGLKHFLVNSAKTRAELAPFVAADASIALYRPGVRNVFGLAPQGHHQSSDPSGRLRLVAVGTVEPRKNFPYAAAIRAALERHGFKDTTLEIVGRRGWGDAYDRLSGEKNVTLHGYLSLEGARDVIQSADLYLCTSHDEGLGLPLLEVQFAGLPVVAPDQPVFREVLGDSGIFIPSDDADAAARIIAAALADPDWRQRGTEAATANLARWNAQAEEDRARIRSWLATLGQQRLAAEGVAVEHTG